MRETVDYWEVLCRVFPLSLLGGAVAIILRMQELYEVRPLTRMLYVAVSTVGVGACAALVAGLALPILPFASTPETDLLVAAVAGSCGQKVFDVLAVKVFGIGKNNTEDQ